LTLAKVDDSVIRIVTQMYRFKLFDNMAQWDPKNHKNNPSTTEHKQLACALAAASTILLKNDGGVLPINNKTIKSIALFGTDASTPTTGGGGSGAVVGTGTISPHTGINARANGPLPPLLPCKCDNSTYDTDTDYFQEGNAQMGATTADDCCSKCSARADCGAWTLLGTHCYFHDSSRPWSKRAKKGCTSCACAAHAPPKPVSGGINVTYYSGKDAAGFVEAANPDVSIVFVSTTSHEGSDRANLNLPPDHDALVKAVAGANSGANGKKTVVVAVTPGALLVPWSDKVAGVLLSMMPGQEYGNGRLLAACRNPHSRLFCP
jgi:hypothetical protein